MKMFLDIEPRRAGRLLSGWGLAERGGCDNYASQGKECHTVAVIRRTVDFIFYSRRRCCLRTGAGILV